jgi:hypothetical protein
VKIIIHFKKYLHSKYNNGRGRRKKEIQATHFCW